MKLEVTSLAALSLLGLAAALPRGIGAPAARLDQRDAGVQKRRVVTEYVYATQYQPTVVVYVDQDGNPVETVVEGQSQPTSPAVLADSEDKRRFRPGGRPKANDDQNKDETPTAPPQPVSSGDGNTAGGKGQNQEYPIGIAYTPYTQGPCKNEAQILADFKLMDGYDLVRIYGTDCDQVRNVVSAAKKTNKQLILGVFDIDNADTELDRILAQGGDLSNVRAITIGNEEVEKARQKVFASGGSEAEADGAAAARAAKVVEKVEAAKARLAGKFAGDVSTVEMFAHFTTYPQLCAASTITTANVHPFFDPSTASSAAADFVAARVADLKKACGADKRVVVTEAGWPKSGAARGAAVPSPQDQETALADLRAKFKHDLVFFSAFDESWKQAAADTSYAEPHWGIL